MVEFVADSLLAAGALGAGFYCWILARRLKRLGNLESGVGGAIASLSKQVDDMTQALETANKSAGESRVSLGELTNRAESVARHLELLVASMHDLPKTQTMSPQPEETKSNSLFLSQRARIHEASEQ